MLRIDRPAIGDVRVMPVHPNIRPFEKAFVPAFGNRCHGDVGKPTSGTEDAIDFRQNERNLLELKKLESETHESGVEGRIRIRQTARNRITADPIPGRRRPIFPCSVSVRLKQPLRRAAGF